MKRALLILALASAAGTASAQTNIATAPATSPVPLNGAANAARQAIERDGYSDVEGLAQDSQGLWHGRAMRGGTEVQLIVDPTGIVSTN
jgi:hypothetical protein